VVRQGERLRKLRAPPTSGFLRSRGPSRSGRLTRTRKEFIREAGSDQRRKTARRAQYNQSVLVGHAAALAFVDTFPVLALIFVGLIPLMFLMRG